MISVCVNFIFLHIFSEYQRNWTENNYLFTHLNQCLRRRYTIGRGTSPFRSAESITCNICLSGRCMSWWRHQMETFSALLALCEWNPPLPVDSPHKDQWSGALMFSLIYAWTNGWANNREAGDLRRHRVHNDVTVMTYWVFHLCLGYTKWDINL